MRTIIALIFTISWGSLLFWNILDIGNLQKSVKYLSVKLALDESELNEQHKHIDIIGGGIQTLSYETDVLTESIKEYTQEKNPQ